MTTKNYAGEFNEEGDQVDASHSRCSNLSRYCHWSMLAISIILIILFAYSAIVQYNDSDSVILYSVFYTLHFAYSLFVSLQQTFACLTCTRNRDGGGSPPAKLAFWAIAAVMAVWSLVMVIIPATKLPVEGGGEDMGGDNDDRTLEEEIYLEIAGGALGFFSSMYHVIWMQLCDRS